MMKNKFARLFLALAVLACGLASAAGPTSGVVEKLFVQNGAGAVPRSMAKKLAETVSVKDFGARGDGVADDTLAIQAAIDYAAGMFNQVAFPPAGAAYNSPIVMFPPGAYRLTNTLNVYAGLTLTGQSGVPNTVEHTRLIMDTAGGTVNLNKHILNLTSTFQGTARSNNVTVTVQDLGFWITNPGSTISGRGGSGWGVDANGIGSAGTGSHIYSSESVIDARIRRCNFYSAPNAAIWLNQADTSKNSDIEISDNEFDTPIISVRFSSGKLNARLKQNQYFGGSYHVHVQDSIGSLMIQGGTMQLQSRIKVNSAAGLDVFTMSDVVSDGASSLGTAVELNKAKQVNISGSTVAVSSGSTFYIVDADGGVISNNVIQNSGYNATTSAGVSDPGAIRLVGSQNVVVTGNSIVTPGAASYAGFGIVSHANGGRTARNVITGNSISEMYTGAGYRGQTRRLNVEATDTIAINRFGPGVAQEYRIIESTTGKLNIYPLTYQATSGTVDLPLDNLTMARATVQMSQLSSAAGLLFDLVIKRDSFSGVYSIVSVSKDGVAGAGNGPHAVTAGNTVAFSIVGSALRMTFAFASDPMQWAAQISGARY